MISLLVKAQNKHQDSGYIIYTLAKDTIEITYYRLSGDDFTATVVQRANTNVNKIFRDNVLKADLEYQYEYTTDGYPTRIIIRNLLNKSVQEESLEYLRCKKRLRINN